MKLAGAYTFEIRGRDSRRRASAMDIRFPFVPDRQSRVRASRASPLSVSLVLVAVGLVLATPHGRATSGPSRPQSGTVTWQALEPGLAYAEIELPQKSTQGDSMARILRAETERFGLKLLNASAEPEGLSRTAREWAKREGAVAVTNASMYQADGRTSVSLMVAAEHVNNGHVSRDRTVLAFDRRDGDVPRVQIIDRSCQDFDALRSHYGSLVQSIRMISCTGKNVWSQRAQQWSTALVATDSTGRLLLIHVRSPYSTHDLIENLLALPIGIERAMYLEGGRPAQLFIQTEARQLEVVGSTSSSGLGGNRIALPFPNALALYRR